MMCFKAKVSLKKMSVFLGVHQKFISFRQREGILAQLRDNFKYVKYIKSKFEMKENVYWRENRDLYHPERYGNSSLPYEQK